MDAHSLPPPDSVNMLDLIPDPEDDVADEENVFRDMDLPEILEDLNARFLVNLPREEMNLLRVYWQAEQAHWFYEDYLRPLNPLLPQLSQRGFSHLIVASSPLYGHLADEDYDEVWDQYCRYKRMVPCCGGILINADGDKVLMVRGWKSNAGWSFPRGKINSEETEEACAIREVEEETGFSLAGMVNPKDRITTQISAQTITMFIVKGIDEATVFETQTRKEIGAIEWVPFVDLPTWSGKKGPKTTGVKGKKFYNVTPFVGLAELMYSPLKRWLSEHGINPNPKRRAKSNAPSGGVGSGQQPNTFRPLEPHFDGQPSRTQQQHYEQHQHDHSALDNLFHRFIHKQEEELTHPDSVGAKDNKAGLERLFQGLDVLDVLEQEDRAVPTRAGGPSTVPAKTLEQSEDDALARLLGGLSTGTPAPQPAVLAGPPQASIDGKANKLLAMLNAPGAADIPAALTQPPTHQASLLAMLSPKQGANTPASVPTGGSTATNPAYTPHDVKKPVSVPTSPRPQSPGQEMRAKQQRALLEQITAGMGLDVPAPKGSYQQGAPISAASATVYTSSPGATGAPHQTSQATFRGQTSSSQSSIHGISPQHHSQSPTSQQGRPSSQQFQPEQYQRPPAHDHTPPGQHSPHATRGPPPPYEPVPSSVMQAFRPPHQFPPGQPTAPALASGHPLQGYQSGIPHAPGVGHGGLSHEQQNLLNTLRNPGAAANNGTGPANYTGSGTGRRGSGSFPPAHAGPNVPGPPISHRTQHGVPPTQFAQPPQAPTSSQYTGTFPIPVHPQSIFPSVPSNAGPTNGQTNGTQGYANVSGLQYPQQPQQHQQQAHGLPPRPVQSQFTSGPTPPTGQGYGYAGPPRPPGPPVAPAPYRGAPLGQSSQPGQPGVSGIAGASYGPQGMYGAQRPNGPPTLGPGRVHVPAPVPSAGGPAPGNFHHPVPRPPNSQTGVLLGMLNDGPR